MGSEKKIKNLKEIDEIKDKIMRLETTVDVAKEYLNEKELEKLCRDYTNSGTVKQLQYEYKKSEEYYTKAVELNEDKYISPYYVRGILRIQFLKKEEEGIADLEQVLKIEPTNQITMLYLGKRYQNRKEYETAISYYNRVLDLNPFNEIASYNKKMAEKN